jgi:hypothetical protein
MAPSSAAFAKRIGVSGLKVFDMLAVLEWGLPSPSGSTGYKTCAGTHQGE